MAGEVRIGQNGGARCARRYDGMNDAKELIRARLSEGRIVPGGALDHLRQGFRSAEERAEIRLEPESEVTPL